MPTLQFSGVEIPAAQGTFERVNIYLGSATRAFSGKARGGGGRRKKRDWRARTTPITETAAASIRALVGTKATLTGDLLGGESVSASLEITGEETTHYANGVAYLALDFTLHEA